MRKLLATTVLGLSMVLASATFALAATTNPGTYDPTSSPDGYVTNGDLKTTLQSTDPGADNGLINDNQTGVGAGGTTVNQSVIKSQGMTNPDGSTGTQRTHGEYQNNTNSCASCHQTHTAAAKNLLMKNTVYDTCTACHDGTLGFYNVFTASSAGTFAGTKDGNASMHLPNAAMQVKAAPGGNRTAATGSWASDFTCASCHAPHGSYSDRLLAYNPNDIANTPASQGGLQLMTGSAVTTDATPLVSALPAANATAPSVVLYDVTSADTANYPAGATGNALIVMKLKNDHGTYSWIRDINPWVAGGEYLQPKFTRFLKNITSTSTTANEADKLNQVSGITVNYAKGFAYAATDLFSDPTTTKIVIARASFVKFVETSQLDATSGVTVTKVQFANYDDAGLGVQITQFCAACHTDYQASSGSATGIWSKAFRHTTTADNYTCLKCHYAHGTDVSVMLDAKNNTVASLSTSMGPIAAKAYMMDKNPSSALKRYTNMSVCWECHTSSHALDLMNNQWIQGQANLTTSEFNTPGTNLPKGFVDPTTSPLQYPYPQ